jgi:site-specific recombinase XerD
MEKIKGSNATGLYQNKLKNGDIAYFFTLKVHGKLEWFKVGLKSNNYRVEDARIARREKYNEVHNVEVKDTQKLGRKKRTIPYYDEIMNQFIDYKITHSIKTKTYENYLGTYNKRVKEFIGHLQIDTITKEHIENIILRHRTSETDPLSLKSLNSILDVVRMVYKYAKENNLYNGEDVTANIAKFEIDNARLKYLTKDEIQTLLDYAKSNIEDRNVYICILLALLTGARMNVVVNIRVSDVNLSDKTIKLFDEKGKRDKHYLGYINDKYYETIKEQVELAKSLGSTLLLTDGSQDKYRARFYKRKMQPIFDKLFNQGIDEKDAQNRVVPHTLRHTFGSQLVINGVDIYTVQKLMNHKNLSTTMRYAKLNDQVKKDGVNRLDF